MNKSDLKNFAIRARLELLQRVADRAALYGVDEAKSKTRTIASSETFHKLDGAVLTDTEIRQRNALIARVYRLGYRPAMEEAAYTWFNRFIAIKYMQEHQLLPVLQRVLPDSPSVLPQVLREAQDVSLPGVDPAAVLALLDANRTDELYKLLLIALCNALSDPLPGMFEKISQTSELLFPDALLKAESVLGELAKLDADSWSDIQVIGWLYQYYNTQLKDETFELLKKNVKITKDRIGAATQLFTPEWIVRYMVENSLGRLWQEGHHDKNLRMKWRYYMDEAPQEPEVAAQLAELRRGYAALQPEQLTVLDPCMGSGHILVYAFDVLMDIYRSVGYTDRDAVQSIMENNLYGLDIDDRAAQLAYFALMMKACEYDRRFLRRGVQPHVCAIAESVPVDEHLLDVFGAEKPLARQLLRTFSNAKEYGSLLSVDMTQDELHRLSSRVDELESSSQNSLLAMADSAQAVAVVKPLLQQSQILACKYDAVITNPPYMGGSGMNENLSRFVKENYPDSKSDLFACFIERGNTMVKTNGLNCMVTMQSWMFLSSFEKMRCHILKTKDIVCLMHMENMVLGIAFGTAVTIFKNAHTHGYKGTYNQIKLCDIENEVPKTFPVSENRFSQVSTDNFSKIPGAPVAYWVSERVMHSFVSGEKLKVHGDTRQGMATSDNNRFLRLWYEVLERKLGIGYENAISTINSTKKWFPYNKGGDYRKWYGNIGYVLNYENNGKKVKEYASSLYGSYSRTIKSESEYFKECLSWSKVSSGSISFRYYPKGFLFDVAGCCIFYENKKLMKYHFGFINSCVAKAFLETISPTINYEAGHIASLPIIPSSMDETIENLVNQNIALAERDWDSFETSWNFKKHPMI